MGGLCSNICFNNGPDMPWPVEDKQMARPFACRADQIKIDGNDGFNQTLNIPAKILNTSSDDYTSVRSKKSQDVVAESDGRNTMPQLVESFVTDPVERNELEEEKWDKVEELENLITDPVERNDQEEEQLVEKLQDKPETFMCEEVTPNKFEEITASEKRHYESIERTLEELDPSIDVKVCGQ